MFKMHLKGYSLKTGLSPGTILPVAEQKMEKMKLTLTSYDEETLEFMEEVKPQDALSSLQHPKPSWLKICGLHDTRLITEIASKLGVHSLIIEDILNPGQRTKIEIFDEYLFLVLKVIHYDEEKNALQFEQFSLLLGRDWLVTFEEKDTGLFETIRNRFKKTGGRLRRFGIDYLADALLDVIVDHYLEGIEKLANYIEDIEGRVIENPNAGLVQEIQILKRDMMMMRKFVWPLRDVFHSIMNEESSIIRETSLPYWQDLMDHIMTVVDALDHQREMLSGILDIYFSSLSNRMNEVMKVLTIIATIFIPITFLAGVYGMNFEFMPELKWRWAYAIFWGIILITVGGLFIFFRRKKWL